MERVLCAKFRMGLFENPFALTGKALKEEFHGLFAVNFPKLPLPDLHIRSVNGPQRIVEGQKMLCTGVMEAGMDVELPSTYGYTQELGRWFAEGRADMAVLDRAVERVLCAKFRMDPFFPPSVRISRSASRATASASPNREVSLPAYRARHPDSGR